MASQMWLLRGSGLDDSPGIPTMASYECPDTLVVAAAVKNKSEKIIGIFLCSQN